MNITSIAILKTYFETNDVPTQEQFYKLLDSLQHKTEHLGPFKSDALAVAGGAKLHQMYRLTPDNVYGIPSPDGGSLKVLMDDTPSS